MSLFPPVPQDTNDFPVPSVYDTTNGTCPAVQSGPASADSHGRTSAPLASYTYDGNDEAIGAKADAAASDYTSSWSTIALLKGLYSTLSGVISVNPGQIETWTMQNGQSGNSDGSPFYIVGYASLISTITLTGFTGTINFEATENGTNWLPIYCVQLDTDTLTNRPVTSTVVGTTTTSIHLYQTDISGFQSIRARTSNVSAGTVTINALASALPFTDHVIHSITCATPVTSGGLTGYHLISAATTNAATLKPSSGQVYSYEIYNANAAVRFVKLYDKATTPTVGTDVVRRTISVPPAGRISFYASTGLAFLNGISLATVTGIADSSTTAVGAGDLSIDIDYM